MTKKIQKIQKTDDEWRSELTPLQFGILRQSMTERPFTGEYLDNKAKGVYSCAGCDQVLFSSDTKYESGCGWPSFWDVLQGDNVELSIDTSHGMVRTEITCSACGGHLGHVFDDGPRDKTGQRYCINSAALKFHPEE